MLLPLVVNRCHYDPDRMRFWKVLQFRKDLNPFEIPTSMLEARRYFEKPTPEHFIYKGEEKVNLRALDIVDNVEDILDQINEGSGLRNEYTREVVERAKSLAHEVSI
jgi:hypothetical protein